MGLNSLTTRASGDTILANFFNDFNTALNGAFVGRNSSGVPTSGQDLGTAALPWGAIRANNLVLNGASVDVSQITSVSNRIVSGKTRSTSNQPAFLTPNGAAASIVLAATSTNLVIDINGASVTVTADITKTGLTTAPASNNTCLLNDGAAAGQADTRIWGEYEHRKSLTVDNMGSSITALVGKWAAFKVAGAATEYLLAYVKSTIELSNVYRGFFYNSSLAPINRTTLTDNDVFTLMSLGWLFVEDNGTTLDVTYTNPLWSFTSPAAPATGDYWFDLSNQTWKRYDGATFQIINRTFVGWAVIDSANCVAARCEEIYGNFSPFNSVDVEVQTTEIIRTNSLNARASVHGQSIDFGGSFATWNITTDLAASADMYNASEQASTTYYLYLKDDGDTVISDIEPHYRPDMYGWYHPHNPWRAVCLAYNNSSSNLVGAESYNIPNCSIWYNSGNGHGSTNTKIRKWTNLVRNAGAAAVPTQSATLGDSFDIVLAGRYCLYHSDIAGAGNERCGISLNTSAPTTDIDTIAAAERLSYSTDTGAVVMDTGITVNLKRGDKVRAHDNGANTGTGTTTSFKIERIS